MSRAASAALAGLLLAAAPAPTLRVKSSPASAPCLAAARGAFERATGRSFTIETGSLVRASSGEGFDVVVGVEGELTRILESGAGELDLGIARIPWVLVGGGGDVRALDRPRGRVHVLGGSAGLEARRFLQHLSADRVRTLNNASGPLELASGDLAVVPLSLAPDAPVTALDIPPLEIWGVAMSASPDPEGAELLVRFLASPTGAATFAACGAER